MIFDEFIDILNKARQRKVPLNIMSNGVEMDSYKEADPFLDKFTDSLMESNLYFLSKNVGRQVAKKSLPKGIDPSLNESFSEEESKKIENFLKQKVEEIDLINFPYENTCILCRQDTPYQNNLSYHLFGNLFVENHSRSLKFDTYQFGYMADKNNVIKSLRIYHINRNDLLHTIALYNGVIDAHILFNELYRSTSVGIETLNKSIRLKNKKSQKYCKVHKVNHVLLKEEDKTIEGISKNEIVWLNSWEVAGHWRGLYKKDKKGKTIEPKERDYSRIGMNRLNQRVEKGKTWIRPCLKGSGPLVCKQRIIIDPIKT